MIFSGAATPSSVVNFSIVLVLGVKLLFSRFSAEVQGRFCRHSLRGKPIGFPLSEATRQ